MRSKIKIGIQPEINPKKSLWMRLAWLVAIWVLSVCALGAAALLIKIFMHAAGMSV